MSCQRPAFDARARAEYSKICTRLYRARAELRHALTRNDPKKQAAAERALARHTAARDTLLDPYVWEFDAPRRIVVHFESPWSGPSGSGIHRHACDMVLDYKDLSGPRYRTVCVISDVNGPPTNARKGPDSMGIAWGALAGDIATGRIVVLEAP